jgi:AcrR family transcriptional regulator
VKRPKLARDVERPDERAAEKKSREEILRAAAEMFMRFGYAATTVDAVAGHLGSTKGRIYHHYRSKADLFFDVQVAAMTQLLAEIGPLACGKGNPVDRLSAMALRHTTIVLSDLPMQKVSVQGLERHLMDSSETNKRLRSVVKMRDEYEQLFAGVIDQGIRAGYFVDMPQKLATKPFFGALNWATVWFSPRRHESAEDLQEIARALASFAIRGLIKDNPNATTREPSLLDDNLG